jgi:hypothetical protein
MLVYELRAGGRDYGRYHTIDEALARVRVAMRMDPDFDPEIIDLRTGRACMVASSRRWRDEIAEKLGA